MGWRSARLFVLIICTLQVIVVIENQVFNFLSFMYGPIISNFLHMMFIVFGVFGAWDCSKKYIRVYVIWNILWMGWNVFVICFYLDVGILDKDSSVLNLGTGGRSWWEIHGVGCIADFTSAGNGSSLEQDPDPSGPFRPTKVEGCVMEYQYVEVLQASMQCLLGVLGIVGGIFMTKMNKEDDDSFEIKEPQGHPMRPPHFTYQTSRGHLDQYQQKIMTNGYGPRSVSPRPMTPRRVKRRSILARDTMNRSSLNSRRPGSSRSRSSQRRARPHQNPVTKLLEQQNRFLDPSGISTSFNDSNTSNYLGGREDVKDFETAYRFKSGLHNPVFQQSSNSSLNQSGVDEIYRPNSARSSYSNYHASRPVSYLHNNEYFSNQAVAQVPISTNRNKGLQRNEESQNNLHPNKTTATLKSFSQKNFNFLGFNLKNNNVNNNNNNNTSSNINNNFSNNYNNNRNVHSVRSDGTVRNSKRFRVDLTRSTERTSNVFFSQGPPAYREGGLDSETVI